MEHDSDVGRLAGEGDDNWERSALERKLDSTAKTETYKTTGDYLIAGYFQLSAFDTVLVYNIALAHVFLQI